ncbi:unnamed protein product [Enterobius vermicularis]|uniref:C2H2-type domain-containing protein n=1 Tax=Enterobius vermicularis TaxID=51028 RepID=A0A0N4VKF7_ENTVE|nr:unnamed protein product [Enterobius vermicularis]
MNSSSSNRKSFDKGDKPRTSSASVEKTSGGGVELDEPFSDSEDETPRGPRKLELNIPRGRIRTLSGTVPIVGYSPKWGGPTMCLSCLQFFDLPSMVDEFAKHLLESHHIVVVEMGLIVDLKRYVEYWRQRFAKTSIDKVFPKIVPKEGDPYFGTTDYYFEMAESLPEDYSLRQRLAMRRLEEALACQQREREDSTFSLQCIFCRYVAVGNRSKIIHHLYMIHHLNLGSPDNLGDLFCYLNFSLTMGNECIYCEKTYSDRNTLMEHMRKRNHREVNPKNHYYDKFYIINYLFYVLVGYITHRTFEEFELGKRWLDVLAEDFEDTMPTFVDSDDEDEQESWHEWQEDNLDIDQTRVICLFCDESCDTIEPMLIHIKEAHECDILDIIEKENMDLYQRMKMINFIRKQNHDLTCFVCSKGGFSNLQDLRKHQAENNHLAKGLPDKALWDAEENLVPIYGNDHLLWMLESYIDEKTAVNDIEEFHPRTRDELQKELVKESEENTVPGVVAEDLPELRNSALADKELYESLK